MSTRSRLWGALAVALACGVLSESSGAAVITSPGPITHIEASPLLACSVRHATDPTDADYWVQSNLCISGIGLVPDGVYGSPYDMSEYPPPPEVEGPPNFSRSYPLLKPVSQSAVTGVGTARDPYTVRTEVLAGASGVTAVETVTYVTGDPHYRTDLVVTNGTTAPRQILVGRAMKCRIDGNPVGFGVEEPVSGSIGCAGSAGRGGRVFELVPLTAGSQRREYPLWSPLETGAICACNSATTNALELLWVPEFAAGETQAFSFLTRLTNSGAPGPGAPEIAAPSEGVEVSGGRTNVTWSVVDRAETYDVVLDGRVVVTTAETNAVVDTSPGDHRVQVVARNPSGVVRSRITRFSAAATELLGTAAADAWVSYSDLASQYQPVFEVRDYSTYTERTERTVSTRYGPKTIVKTVRRNGQDEEGFWPIALDRIFDFRSPRQGSAYQQFPCIAGKYFGCSGNRRELDANDLRAGTGAGKFIDFPASPSSTDDERRMFQKALNHKGPNQGTAAVYKYAGEALEYRKRRYGTLTMQYWAFYAFNSLPHGHHEGDWEHVSIVFDGVRDDANSRVRNPRPVGVLFAAHDDGVFIPWKSDRLQRISDGGRCDWRHRDSPNIPRGGWVCAYVAHGSHAAYNRPGTHSRPGLIPDDFLSPEFDHRWHLRGSASLISMASQPWRCWKGRVGQDSNFVNTKVGVTPPLMPLNQQRVKYPGDKSCGGSSSKSLIRAQAASASGGQCDLFSPKSYEPGQTSVFVCDEAVVNRWVTSGFGADHEIFSVNGRVADVVGLDETPTSEIGKTTISATSASRPTVVVATLGADHRLELVTLTDVALDAGAAVRLDRATDGSISLIASEGRVIARGAPTVTTTGVPPIEDWGPRSVSATKVRNGVTVVRWAVRVGTADARYTVTAIGGRNRLQPMVTRLGGKTTYSVRLRVPRPARQIRVAATLGAFSSTERTVKLRR